MAESIEQVVSSRMREDELQFCRLGTNKFGVKFRGDKSEGWSYGLLTATPEGTTQLTVKTSLGFAWVILWGGLTPWLCIFNIEEIGGIGTPIGFTIIAIFMASLYMFGIVLESALLKVVLRDGESPLDEELDAWPQIKSLFREYFSQ